VKIARKINSCGGVDGVRVTKSTVRRDLLAMGFKAVRRPRVPPLSAADKKERVEFCRWLLKECPILVVSDEKLFNIVDHGPRHDWIEVGKGEKPMGRETPQHGGTEKLWIWGAISIGFRSFVTFETTSITKHFYRWNILDTVIDELKAATDKGRKIYFMQDNAKPHNGAYEWLERRGVAVLPRRWPPRSCDLNPIEQLWAIMQRAVSDRAPFSSDDLHQFIDDYVEKELTQTTIDKLCKSISERARRVIAAGGEIIKI
jgi:transposase